MRSVIAALVLIGLMIGSVSAAPILARVPASHGYAVAADHASQDGPVDVNIDVNRADGAWYTSPVWIAVGILAFVAIIGLVLAAGRRRPVIR